MRSSSHVDPRRRRIAPGFSLDRSEGRTPSPGPGGSKFAGDQGRLTVETTASSNRIVDRRLDVDEGNDSEGGTAASVVGHVAGGLELQDGRARVPYVSPTREHAHTATVKADAQGNLWPIVGADSGFEGATAIDFQGVAVAPTPVAPA